MTREVVRALRHPFDPVSVAQLALSDAEGMGRAMRGAGMGSCRPCGMPASDRFEADFYETGAIERVYVCGSCFVRFVEGKRIGIARLKWIEHRFME